MAVDLPAAMLDLGWAHSLALGRYSRALAAVLLAPDPCMAIHNRLGDSWCHKPVLADLNCNWDLIHSCFLVLAVYIDNCFLASVVYNLFLAFVSHNCFAVGLNSVKFRGTNEAIIM